MFMKMVLKTCIHIYIFFFKYFVIFLLYQELVNVEYFVFFSYF